jgi:hypothetical protein
MLNDIQHTMNQREGLEELLYSITSEDDRPGLTIDNIHANLGIKRDIGKDIEAATEAYTLACVGPLGLRCATRCLGS